MDVRQSFAIGARRLDVLRGISLDVRAGEAAFLVGASGAGKTTLLYILAGLERPASGQVIFEGQSIYDLGRRAQARLRNAGMGFIFQGYFLLPELTALENVLLPAMIGRSNDRERRERAAESLREVGLGDRLHHLPLELSGVMIPMRQLGRWTESVMRDRAAHLLDAVGLGSKLRRPSRHLSGGEQQRVAIARALINDPSVVFADEPTGNLDSKAGSAVIDLLLNLVREKRKTLLVVTHDLNLATRGDRTLEMRDGLLGGATSGLASAHE